MLKEKSNAVKQIASVKSLVEPESAFCTWQGFFYCKQTESPAALGNTPTYLLTHVENKIKSEQFLSMSLFKIEGALKTRCGGDEGTR